MDKFRGFFTVFDRRKKWIPVEIERRAGGIFDEAARNHDRVHQAMRELEESSGEVTALTKLNRANQEIRNAQDDDTGPQ